MATTSIPRTRMLLLGTGGQIGRALRERLPALGPLVAVARADVDLEDGAALERLVERSGAGVIVNAAAYTAVDAAETDRERCMRVNADAPRVLARAASRAGALMVHYSTNYVFDGKANRPYREDDPAAPLGVYGESKLLGEQAVAAEHRRHLILRTSGVYGWTGTNFLRRILELAHEREELRVVHDQVVAPSPAESIAAATVEAIRQLLAGADAGAFGTYHVTSAGAVSWFDFARAIIARDPRRAEQRCRMLTPVTSEEFITPARRPANGLLDNARFVRRFGIALDDWEAELDRVFAAAPVPG